MTTGAHRRRLPRAAQRAARRARPAPVVDVTFGDAGDGGVWLDIAGRAGVHFTLEEWARLVAEASELLRDMAALRR